MPGNKSSVIVHKITCWGLSCRALTGSDEMQDQVEVHLQEKGKLFIFNKEPQNQSSSGMTSCFERYKVLIHE